MGPFLSHHGTAGSAQIREPAVAMV